jgi:hypothetical protein
MSFFEIFETGTAQIYADLLEIRMTKKNQMSMGVNQKYYQSRHLISRNSLSFQKKRAS